MAFHLNKIQISYVVNKALCDSVLAAVLRSCPTLKASLTPPFQSLIPQNARQTQGFGSYSDLSSMLFPWLRTWLTPWCYLGPCSNVTSLELFLNITEYHCWEPLYLLSQHLTVTYSVSLCLGLPQLARKIHDTASVLTAPSLHIVGIQ